MKEKVALSEDDYRQWLLMQGLQGLDAGSKKAQILDLIWNDAKRVQEAPLRRLDAMCLEAISSGVITIDVANNPDGVIISQPLSLLMPASNKVNAAVTWATKATATPIKDIQGIVRAAEDKGVTFEKMLMTKTKFWQMIETDEVVNSLKGYFNNASKNIPTLDQMNTYLSNNGFPMIELISWTTGIEKDGKITNYKPFKEANVSFIPSGNLGVMHNALAIEQISPVDQVSYAVANKVLVSKWKENDPFNEFTMGELNAFPGFEAIDSIYLLNTLGA
jgi:hypothetical protein